MKKVMLIAGFLTLGLFAADFSQMTLQELNDMRDKVTVEDQAAYVAELRKRMAEMTPQEKAKYEAIKMLEAQEKPAE